MNTLAELTEKVLALPADQRFALALDLWASLDEKELPGWTEEELREELRQRLRDEPDDTWKSHGEIMDQARREFGWREKSSTIQRRWRKRASRLDITIGAFRG